MANEMPLMAELAIQYEKVLCIKALLAYIGMTRNAV